MIGDSLEIVLIFGLIGLFTNWIAWSKGFYRLPASSKVPVTLGQVVIVFAIYLGTMIFIAPLLESLLISLAGPAAPPPSLVNAVRLMLIGFLILALAFFSVTSGKEAMSRVWQNGDKPFYVNLGMGMLTWIISYPVIAVVGQLLDLLIYLIVGMENYEQVAVRYLRETIASPSQLAIALFTIVIFAPAMEEFLFRGCLQTYLKNHLGTKAAILVTALCFALFHFSSSQGVGNISLIASLFAFACFLGFIYERQRSLFASIGLHATFNAASCIRIVLFPDG